MFKAPTSLYHCLLPTITCLVLIACSTKPYVDYDTTFRFADASTFYLLPGPDQEEPLMSPRIAAAIAGELSARGLRQTDAREGADLAVRYLIRAEERPNTTRISIGLGTGSYGSHGGASVGGGVSRPVGNDTLPYTHIQIEMYPGNADTLIWRSSDAFELKGSPEKRAENARRLVQRLLSEFPPNHTP